MCGIGHNDGDGDGECIESEDRGRLGESVGYFLVYGSSIILVIF